jgi:hypothetical protein
MNPRVQIFHCPNCDALHHVIKVEAGPENGERDVICPACGGPLPGREAQFVLKYFLLRKAISRIRKKPQRP